MKLWKLAACLPLVFAGASAMAEPAYGDIEPILKKNACLACHAVDKKMIGPAYQEVHEKHDGDADAVATLAKHIMEGSSGVWGAVPMPPNVGVKADEAELIAKWVMAGAKQ